VPVLGRLQAFVPNIGRSEYGTCMKSDKSGETMACNFWAYVLARRMPSHRPFVKQYLHTWTRGWVPGISMLLHSS